MDRYLIHYYSGTGNTYHLVKTIENELRNKGHEVELINIEKEKSSNYEKELNSNIINIFCFPVYGFGTPSLMLKYISRLKINKGCRAVIICTSGGFEGQALHHSKWLLNKRGFDVFYTDMVIYTHNWTQVINPQSKDIEEKVFKEANIKTAEIVEKIIRNESYIMKRNIITLMVSWIVFTLYSNLGRRVLGKTFIADGSCSKCGKCENICPAKAISLFKDKPIWNSRCEGCQRCINMCPKKSIQLSIVKLAVFVISELLPILILIEINYQVYNLPVIFNIILFCIMFVINTIIADILILYAEKVKAFRKILELSYTKKYRRNIAKGFNIK